MIKDFSSVIHTPGGSIKIGSLWDFMREVRKDVLHPNVARDFAITQKEEYNNLSLYFPDSLPAPVFSKTYHVLKQNPISVLSELKKSLTKIKKYGKSVNLEELIYNLNAQSSMDFGNLTHMFPIGQHLYALVGVEDMCLFVNENYKQSLVCVNPKRNFQIYVPNLKVESW